MKTCLILDNQINVIQLNNYIYQQPLIKNNISKIQLRLLDVNYCIQPIYYIIDVSLTTIKNNINELYQIKNISIQIKKMSNIPIIIFTNN